MVATINAKELYPETRKKLGVALEEAKSDIQTGVKSVTEINQSVNMSPVPPKPDVSGMSPKRAAMTLHDFYEANAPAILQCRQEKGDTAARKLWGFSYKGWESFLKRHDITERLKPPAAGEKAKASPTKKPLIPLSSRANYRQRIELPPPKITASELDEDKFTFTIKGKFIPDSPDEPKPDSAEIEIKKHTKSNEESNSNLPLKFPAFNERWSDEVKAVWLKSYVDIYRIEWARETKHKENRLLKILRWWRW